jgi:glycosyltransferase involved in cell wall biosynthesis
MAVVMDGLDEIAETDSTCRPKVVSAQQRPRLSIVCTVYNEEEAVPRLLDLLAAVVTRIDIASEIIIVDDGSTDRTLARAKAAIDRVPCLRVVQLYRNYGQVTATSAGMTFARGDWVVMMDGDLQHDPEDIRRFVAEIPNGHDLVATYRERREETRRRLFVTWIGNRINRYLTGVPIRDFGSGYRLMSARLLEMITDGLGYVRYNTPALYMNARSVVELPITQSQRPYGKSKWNLIAFILYNLDFLIHSKKIVQVLLSVAVLGGFVGTFLYLLNLIGFAEPARAVSAPVSIVFTSFLVVLLTVIWREVMQTQNLARGQPLFLIAGIWADDGNGVPGLEPDPRLRSGRLALRQPDASSHQ